MFWKKIAYLFTVLTARLLLLIKLFGVQDDFKAGILNLLRPGAVSFLIG
jgi:hypothetical protein